MSTVVFGMENTNIDQHETSVIGIENTSEEKRCWICFGTDKDESEDGRWVSPCKCVGCTQWAHQVCAQRWIDEIFKENINAKPYCAYCNTEYKIVSKEVNYFVRVLNNIDIKCNQICQFMVVGTVFSFVYWSITSYGAITVIQVFGQEEGILMMDNTTSFILLLTLPTIPISLLIGKNINWEDSFLLLVQRFTAKLPMLRNIMPAFLIEPVNIENSTWKFSPVVNSSALFCSALLLPTCATVVGKLIFKHGSYTKFQQTLFGGLIYIAVKGILRIYQKQNNVIHQRSRLILNYADTNTEEKHE